MIYPLLGPLVKLGESPLEQYSRVYTVLKSLQTIIMPTKWKEAFSGNKHGFATLAITPKYISIYI